MNEEAQRLPPYKPAPRSLVLKALKRDNFTCQDCGKQLHKGRYIGNYRVHHILPVRLGGEHSLDNLVSLCAACHAVRDAEHNKEATKRTGRKNVNIDGVTYGSISEAARTLKTSRERIQQIIYEQVVI